jgi:hypothetical protein
LHEIELRFPSFRNSSEISEMRLEKSDIVFKTIYLAVKGVIVHHRWKAVCRFGKAASS